MLVARRIEQRRDVHAVLIALISVHTMRMLLPALTSTLTRALILLGGSMRGSIRRSPTPGDRHIERHRDSRADCTALISVHAMMIIPARNDQRADLRINRTV